MSEQKREHLTQQLQPDCDALRELLPAYSIGATDPEEARLVESLASRCPEVTSELGEYQALFHALHYSVPSVQPPAHLHDRLMAAMGDSSQRAPDASIGRPPALPLQKRPVWLLRQGMLRLALAAAVLLLAISNVYWMMQVAELRRTQDDQEKTITQLREQSDALVALSAGKAGRIELMSTQETRHVAATVLWHPENGAAFLYTDRLPALTPDLAYQLWLIRDGKRTNGGVFQVDAQGRGTLIFWPPEPLDSYDALGISTEPALGSEAPTTPPVAFGEL